MKNILALDTATAQLSLCLKKGNSYFELNIQDGLKHSETLMVLILKLMEQAEIQKEDLDLLICSEGPGSFTGLRIGMSTVKGLSFGLEIPYTAVPSCDYQAYGYDFFDGAVVPVMDARKKRVYTAIYHHGTRQTPLLDISEDELFDKLKAYPRVLFTGPDCQMMQNKESDSVFIDTNAALGRGRALLACGMKRFSEEGSLPENAGPVYLRKSEAEIALYGENN